MDPRSKLLSAIALATLTASVARPASAQPVSLLEPEALYNQCLDTGLPVEDRVSACACFVDAFPENDLVSAVVSIGVGLGRDIDILGGSSQDNSCGGGLSTRLINDDEIQVAIY